MTPWLEINPLVRAVGIALVEFLWQGAAIGVLGAVVLVALRRASAQARYVVACAFLAAMAAAPVMTVIKHAADPVSLSLQPRALLSPLSSGADDDLLASSADNANATSTAISSLDRQLPLIVFLWSGGVLLLTLRLLRGWLRMRQLRAAAVPLVDGAARARLAALCHRLGVSVRVQLIESPVAAVPFVMGWLRPAIVVPTSVLAGLTPSQFEAILAHELMHVRRFDYLVNVMQCGVEILLFYHPAVWWMSRQVRIEREHCCDDFASAATGDPVSYAAALASLEELRSPKSALALAAGGGDLVQRIRRLVAPNSPSPSAHSGGLGMCAALVLVMFALSGSLNGFFGSNSMTATSAAGVAVELAPPPTIAADSHALSAMTSAAEVRSMPAQPVPERERTESAPSAVVRVPDLQTQIPTTSSDRLVIVVEDAQGVLPGARARLSNAARGVDWYAITNSVGRAVFPGVPAGDYLLSVEMAGFKRANLGVGMPSGDAWARVEMQVGSLSESITVVTQRSPNFLERAQSLEAVRVQSGPQNAPLAVQPAGAVLMQGQPPDVGQMPVRVGGDITPPRKLVDVRPLYPSDAIAANVEGIVILEATISQDGTVRDARVIRGAPSLSDAALVAVTQWQFSPTLQNRRPVDVLMTVTVNFALQ